MFLHSKSKISSILLTVLVSSVTSGCVGKLGLTDPTDIMVTDMDLVKLDQTFNDRVVNGSLCTSPYQSSNTSDTYCRDNFVTMKMYEIDVIFTQNIHDLARGNTAIALFGDLAVLGLNAAATAIPVSQTTKVLNAVAVAVGASNSAINKDVLLAQSLQLIEIQMRTNRSSVKQTILARLGQCKMDQYTIGLALSDLQAYADAGTLERALETLTKSVSSTQATASTSKGTAAPATTSAVNQSGQLGSASGGDYNGTVTPNKKNKGSFTIAISKSKASVCPIEMSSDTPGKAKNI